MAVPHSKYDLRHFLSDTPRVGYDTVLLHIVSATLAVLSAPDLAALVTSVPWAGQHGNRRRRGAGYKQEQDGLLLWVSLPRVIFGTNARVLLPNELERALGAIADALGVGFRVVADARVYRLDVVGDLVLSRRPSDYLRRLAHVSRAARQPYSPTSIAFVNKTRELAFYDKVCQLVETGQNVPTSLREAHVLRYELRLLKGLTHAFGHPVRASDLSEHPTCQLAVGMWADRFTTIKTQPAPALDGPMHEAPATIPELMWALAAPQVAEHGAAAVIDALDAHHAEGLITGDQRGRLRTRVLDLAAVPLHTDDLVAELQAAVDQAVDQPLP